MTKPKSNEIFIHPLADVQTTDIGKQTRIWQFSSIMENVKIGVNCNISSHTFIENNVIIGNNVTIKSGVFLWDGLIIEDNVFIGPNVTFTNDKYPRSKQYLDSYQKTVIQHGASIGANATILGGLIIGSNSLIGAGSVVTKHIASSELWVGNPAKFVRNL
ncbi:dTDP-6-deoxy-3,4-keto-hexulose isomerase [Tenacibaculum sp. SZ-18]|uniref:acyltransferase n=1 Tax=Tenacibaculum sp. SZ-18 TaxID=754423 RepID=UPI000C2D3B29|nr:acyltransferase [Tenacibaculum sp. SZ-18]AUC15829.1 dTDP-6-deoxy-3,4-keto-hexulose isomerase [Tenacibaculum sp. SZ-18]